MKQVYPLENLERLTYQTCGEAIRRQFEEWIAAMTMEPDGEWGQDRTVDGDNIAGFLTWIKEHNAAFTAGTLFQTYIWRDRVTGVIVATGTIAPDDRGVKEQYQLGGQGLWGGVNVRVGYRGLGIGRYICADLDQRIQLFAQGQEPLLFHLFTANPIAEAIYQSLGFAPNPLGEIHTAAFGEERLWSKTYTKNDLLDY